MTTESEPNPLNHMTDEELGGLVRGTPVFRLAIACARFDDSVRELQENDHLAWDRLIDETLKRQSRVKSRDTIEGVILVFLESIQDYADLAREPEDVAEAAAKEAIGNDPEETNDG